MAHAEPRLVEIILDDATWDAASLERRGEWRVVLDELIEAHKFALTPPPESAVDGSGMRLFVTADPERIRFDAQTLGGRHVVAAEVPIAEMRETLAEYFKICFDMGRLGEGDNSSKLEALDIAKRLVHDEAAEVVQRLLHPLAPDHPTARRLFTLVVALHFDTTRLVRPHHLDATLQRLRE